MVADLWNISMKNIVIAHFQYQKTCERNENEGKWAITMFFIEMFDEFYFAIFRLLQVTNIHNINKVVLLPKQLIKQPSSGEKRERPGL